MLPDAFLRRMQMQLGDGFSAFLQALERERAVGLRLNTLKAPPSAAALLPFGFVGTVGAEEMRRLFGALPESERKTLENGRLENGLLRVPWAENGYYYRRASRPGLSPLHEAGVYYLQEPSAMLPAELLGAEPGMRVLDLCAAPGGKTTQIAAKMRGKGVLIANEIHPQRAKILSRNVERCGVENCIVLNEHPSRLEERFVGFFDRILVDAPCSGEGMFKKEADAVTDWSEETVRMCARRQAEILRSALRMLRPGGRLVYSTCTFSEEENLGTVTAQTGAGSGVNLLKTVSVLPHEHLGEGQFAALLEKTDGENAPISRKSAKKACNTHENDAVAAWRRFREENGLFSPERETETFGQTVWCPPEPPVELSGLRVLRNGLELGTAKKDVFLPAHAFALWLGDAPRSFDLPPESENAARYLRGETLASPLRGWTLVKVGGFSLGWAKGSDGILKNHFPKGLRRTGGSERSEDE